MTRVKYISLKILQTYQTGKYDLLVRNNHMHFIYI